MKTKGYKLLDKSKSPWEQDTREKNNASSNDRLFPALDKLGWSNSSRNRGLFGNQRISSHLVKN